MEEKYTITIQVTAEQGERIFKLLSGTKSRQAKYQENKRKAAVQKPIKQIATNPNQPKILTMEDLHPGFALHKQQNQTLTIQAPSPEAVIDVPPKQEQPVYTVWEVEPSLTPPGVRDTRALIVNCLTKEQMVPANQDLSGLDKNDPANEVVLEYGNRFYAQAIEEFDNLKDATVFSHKYAMEEGINMALPTKFKEYYEVKEVTV